MPPPVSIAHVHVHALRLASGAEALVARVLTPDGVAGFGFSFGPEAFPARDMAAWDAAARRRNLPLYALVGGKMRERVAVASGKPGWVRIDPFNRTTIEAARGEALAHESLCLVAPHGHPWEVSCCAALAASLPGEALIAVPEVSGAAEVVISDAPGIDIDWSLEPGFRTIAWYGFS